MKKISIWSAETNRDIRQARNDGAIYECILPDETSLESITRILETVGDCYRGEKDSFQFEWERIPEKYALVTYTKSTLGSIQACVGCIELYSNDTSFDLTGKDYHKFVSGLAGTSEVREINGLGKTSYHFTEDSIETIVIFTKIKTVSLEVGKAILEFNE